MMGFLRFSLLLFLLFGSRTMHVRADEGTPPPAPQEAAPARSFLVSHTATLLLDGAGQRSADDLWQTLPTTALNRYPALTLYAGPTATFPTNLAIPEGAELTLRSILADGSWVEVEWQGQRGWVPTEAVELVQRAPLVR